MVHGRECFSVLAPREFVCLATDPDAEVWKHFCEQAVLTCKSGCSAGSSDQLLSLVAVLSPVQDGQSSIARTSDQLLSTVAVLSLLQDWQNSIAPVLSCTVKFDEKAYLDLLLRTVSCRSQGWFDMTSCYYSLVSGSCGLDRFGDVSPCRRGVARTIRENTKKVLNVAWSYLKQLRKMEGKETSLQLQTWQQ